jgi:hypothetical protein
MHKIKSFAVAAALIVAGVGAWVVATTTQARVTAPIEARGIDPLQITINAKELPTEEFVDYSFVFTEPAN